jgi:hypothetical protein
MPDVKFPPTVEIKRAIAAAERAGVHVKSIEIHPRKIIIFAVDQTEEEPRGLTYSEWKAVQRDIR